MPTEPTAADTRPDTLLLKWGTMKGWELRSEAAKAAGKRYLSIGEHSAGAMSQRDTEEQRIALCEVIDAIDGTIRNDWSGDLMSKDEAKRYVLEFPK